MSVSSPKYNFKEFLKMIDINCHDKNVKQFSTKSSIVSLNDFYVGLKQEINSINSKITPSKKNPSIADFADVFKVFDVYPTNIVKLKKPGSKDLSRMNSIILKVFLTSAGDVTQREGSDTSLDSPKINLENWKSGSEVYQDFLKFEKKLKQLQQKLQTQILCAEYTAKLKQINLFGQQLEKLLDFNGIRGPAFSCQDELQLGSIQKDIDKLYFLRNNQAIFNNLNGTAENVCVRLDSLLEMISYALISISFFNIIY